MAYSTASAVATGIPTPLLRMPTTPSMHLSFLRLTHFGPFERFEVELPETGLCAFVGPNGSGKTTIVSAIEAIAVGRQAVSIRPEGRGPSRIELGIRSVDEESVARVLIETRKDSVPTFYAATTGVPDLDHDQILGRLREVARSATPPRLVFRDAEGASTFTLNELENIRAELPLFRLPAFMREELERLARPGQSIASSGMRSLVGLLNELAARSSQGAAVPLILDEPFAYLEESVSRSLAGLLLELGRMTQIILLSCTPPKLTDHVFSIEALGVGSPGANAAGPSYAPLRHRESTSGSTRRYLAGTTIGGLDEDKHLEFKEVQGANPVVSIAALVDHYVVAYMNSRSTGKGKILWGVKDNGQVVGVQLTKAQRDELRRVVTEKLHKITPTIAPSAYSIHLHPVYPSSDDGERWIVEVVVPPSTETTLFATGKQEVYIKTDAGKKKLSVYEIQMELLRRIGELP